NSWNQRFNNCPLNIANVSIVRFSLHPSILPNEYNLLLLKHPLTPALSNSIRQCADPLVDPHSHRPVDSL
ncbi:hypothetical protein, partial [Gloeocapsopsis sp. IPPAS B-1203]|uniref:hypothetical protein n=1 Tax=Gloeocapsopsis sp. IPPAS B-1203 TaxID=2049454 RepID=UPI0025A2CE7F